MKILRKLNQSEANISALVSKKWKQVVSDGIGFTFNPEDSIYRIEEFGYNRCIFSEISIEAPPFKFPMLVRTVHLTGILSQQNFERLIPPLQNLSEFKTNIQALSYIDMDKIPTLTFPELKEFTLTYPRYCRLTAKRVQTIIKLLKKLQCPQLEILNLMGFPVVRNHEGCSIQAIYNLLLRNGKTLKKVLLNLQQGRLRNIDPTLDNIPIPTNDLESIIGRRNNTSKFYLECTEFREPVQGEIISLFNNWIQNQDKLSELYINTVAPIIFPIEMLTKSESTIASIELTVLPIDGNVDCNVFAMCPQLKILTLVGRNLGDWDDQIVEQRLTNASSLPIRLKSIRIGNLLTTSNDAQCMALNLPDLVLLELFQIGVFADYGVTLDTLNQIFLQKRIKAIRINHGVSESSLMHPSPALSFTATLFMRLSDRQRHKFNLFLDENNDYSFGYGNLVYFRENSTTYLLTGETNHSEDISNNFHDHRLSFNPRFGLEELTDDPDDWFSEEDDDDEDNVEFLNIPLGALEVDDDNDDADIDDDDDDDGTELTEMEWPPPEPELELLDGIAIEDVDLQDEGNEDADIPDEGTELTDGESTYQQFNVLTVETNTAGISMSMFEYSEAESNAQLSATNSNKIGESEMELIYRNQTATGEYEPDKVEGLELDDKSESGSGAKTPANGDNEDDNDDGEVHLFQSSDFSHDESYFSILVVLLIVFLYYCYALAHIMESPGGTHYPAEGEDHEE